MIDQIHYRCRREHPVSLALIEFSNCVWMTARRQDGAQAVTAPSRHSLPLRAVLRQLDEAAEWGAARSVAYGSGALALAAWRSAGRMHFAVLDREQGRAWTAPISDTAAIAALTAFAAGLARQLDTPHHQRQRRTAPHSIAA